MLKIGYITTSLSSRDGWGRYSKSLIESVSNFADISVITQKSLENDTSVKVYPVLPDFDFSLPCQLKAFYYTLKYFRSCDVIHSLVEPFAPGAALAAKIIGAKLVMTLHGTYSIPPAGFRLRSLLIKFALKSAAITTTGSKYTETKARRRANFGECIFIPNGIDPQKFYKISDLPKENFILTVGWLKSRKGMDLFVKAFIHLKDRYPELRCKLAGGSENDKFQKYLFELVRENKIENRVDFLGRVSDSDLVSLYNKSKVFVFPARDVDENFEGFPMVFYEANICGTPVVTTRGFGSEYAIIDGENGFLTEPDNVKDIAGATEKILSNPELASSMERRSLEIAGNHTWDKIVSKILDLYQKALTR